MNSVVHVNLNPTTLPTYTLPASTVVIHSTKAADDNLDSESTETTKIPQ